MSFIYDGDTFKFKFKWFLPDSPISKFNIIINLLVITVMMIKIVLSIIMCILVHFNIIIILNRMNSMLRALNWLTSLTQWPLVIFNSLMLVTLLVTPSKTVSHTVSHNISHTLQSVSQNISNTLKRCYSQG